MTWLKNIITAFLITLVAVAMWLADLARALADVIRGFIEARQATKIVFVEDGKGELEMPAESTLHNNAKKHFAIVFKDAAGAVAPIDGKPSISNLNPDLCEVAVDDDGMGFMVSGLNAPSTPNPGAIGDAKVNVEADVDLGDGFKPLDDFLLVHLIAPAPGEATAITFEEGTEEPLG